MKLIYGTTVARKKAKAEKEDKVRMILREHLDSHMEFGEITVILWKLQSIVFVKMTLSRCDSVKFAMNLKISSLFDFVFS